MPDLTPMATVEARSVLPRDWAADLGSPLTVDLTLAVTELIRRATSRMPQDIIEALVAGRNAETDGSRAANTLDTMLENIQLADDHVAPLCQDTGTVIFWVRHPFGFSQQRIRQQIRAAVRECTRRSWLRPNCVEALSGRNPGDNMDPFLEGHPVIHFEEKEGPGLEVSVMLKGGGCASRSGRRWCRPRNAPGCAPTVWRRSAAGTPGTTWTRSRKAIR